MKEDKIIILGKASVIQFAVMSITKENLHGLFL